MANKKEQKELQGKFLNLSKWDDLVELIEFYQKNEKEVSKEQIEKKHISYLLFSKKKKYKSYRVPKKIKGKFRTLEAPTDKLKLIQHTIKYCIELCYHPRSAAHGFVKERSIVTNARNHVGRAYIYNIDLENFFPTIHFGRIKGIFRSKPFSFSPDVATTLANLCCNDEGKLPQGAPTSPILSNLICRALDGKLSKLAKSYKIKYTRYVDDITFSSNYNVFDPIFFNLLEKVVQSEGFKIHPDKIRLLDTRRRQEVTGLVVNNKLNVKKEYIKNLKWLIKIKKKAKEKNDESIADNWLKEHYLHKHRYNGKIPEIDKIIRGKLDFLKMVVGEKTSGT